MKSKWRSDLADDLAPPPIGWYYIHPDEADHNTFVVRVGRMEKPVVQMFRWSLGASINTANWFYVKKEDN